jgi:hypothetical protein
VSVCVLEMHFLGGSCSCLLLSTTFCVGKILDLVLFIARAKSMEIRVLAKRKEVQWTRRNIARLRPRPVLSADS